MTTWPRLLACMLLTALLAACGSSSKQRGGGYYKDDGPGSRIPANISSIPNPEPRIEPLARANARPYTVMGRRYVPIADSRPFRQEGVASWYGRKFHGQRTANGERYDMYAMTAAHPTLPLPSYARVTRVDNGETIVVRINDRGPFLHSRVIDLSYAAAAKLGFINQGSARVRVEAITHEDIRIAQRRGISLAANSPASRAQAPAPVPAPTPRPAVRVAANDTPSSSLPAAPAPAPAPPPAPVPVPITAVQAETPDALNALAVMPAAGHDQAQAAPAPFSAVPSPVSMQAGSPSITGDGAQIYLQFGAFSAPDTAQGMAQRINARIGHIEGRSAHIHQASGLHRVRIGPYPNRTEAVNAAVRIQEHTGKQATIALQ